MFVDPHSRDSKKNTSYGIKVLSQDTTTKKSVSKIQQVIGPHGDLLTTVKRRKLQWYGHVFRSSGLAKPILQGTVKGGRRQGGQRKRREDIREWAGLEFAESKEGRGEQKNGGR